MKPDLRKPIDPYACVPIDPRSARHWSEHAVPGQYLWVAWIGTGDEYNDAANDHANDVAPATYQGERSDG